VWLDLLFPPTCLGCGALRPQESLCPACAAATGTLPSPEALPEVWAELPYDGAWAGALHQLKYRGQLAFAGPLGRRLGCSPVFAEPWDALVPVPLHWRRRWRRGFNQVELLLRAATARRPDLRGRVVPALLQRVRAGPPQATLPAQARAEAVTGAFRVPMRRRSAVAGRRMLLVDDVVTTGATLAAARAALEEAGASAVAAVALLRAL